MTPVCTPPSASQFPIGPTKVSCTARDQAGNTSNPVTVDVVVTPPATTTKLYQEMKDGKVVRAKVRQPVIVPVELGNRGSGTLLGRTLDHACVQTGGAAMTLQPVPLLDLLAGLRNYSARQSGFFALWARPAQAGTATFSCTVSMADSFGAPVSATSTLTIDARR